MNPGNILFQQRIVFRQVFRVPDCQLVPQRLLGNLIFGQGLYHLVMDQQPVYVQEFLACRIGRLELDHAAPLRIFHAGKQRAFEQLGFMFQFFNDDLRL
jgi:hypothetical protein